MQQQYHARDLVDHYTESDIWNLPEGKHTVIFDDGKLEMPLNRIIFSHYYWRLHREFPGAPIKTSHAMTMQYVSSTHLTLGAKIFWDVYNGTRTRSKNLIWDMSKIMYEIGNAIYNMVCTRLSSQVTTASIYDVIDVLEEPRVCEAKDKYAKVVAETNYDGPTVENAIKETHQAVEEVLYGDDAGTLKGNNIRKLCRSRIVNKGQMLQLVGPRGFVNEVNGDVFKYPVDVGYAEGMFNLYDSAIESRSASRSLFMNTDPLRKSEYFNRRMQLLCSVIHSVKGTSCKGFVTVPYLVQAENKELLRGKFHMVGGQAEPIWGNIKPLVGRVIQLRSMLGCNNKDPQTVCRTCLGWSANIIPPKTNIGYALTTELCAVISQLMLSTKHYEASSASKELELDVTGRMWFRKGRTDQSKIYLKKDMVKKNPIIRLDLDSVKLLNQILNVDVSELPASRITNCSSIAIVASNDEGAPIGPLDIAHLELSGSGVSLSSDVLQYLKDHGWTSTSSYIEFRLDKWDIDKPLFNTPRRGDNIFLFMKEVESFIVPGKESERCITEYHSRGQALSEFVLLLSKCLNFNIVEAEIFIRACMKMGGDEKDFRLPRANEEFEFVNATKCLSYRSLTSMLAFEHQTRYIFDPDWFLPKPRMKHMMDDFLKH